MQKILIVDDNADVLQVMQLLLGSRGYKIEVTTAGEKTYDLVDSFKPELIFLDVHLSGIDGRDISRRLKRSEQTKGIPIILFSANLMSGETLSDSLANEFIAKPFDIHDLVSKVNSLIHSSATENNLVA